MIELIRKVFCIHSISIVSILRYYRLCLHVQTVVWFVGVQCFLFVSKSEIYYVQYQSKVWTHLLIQGFFFVFTIFYIIK